MSSHQNGHPNRAVNRTHPERGIPQRAELVVQSAVPENTKAVRINFKFLQSGGYAKTHLVVFADFANEVAECFVHVYALLSRRFDESAPQLLGKVTTLCVITKMSKSWRRHWQL